VSELPLGWAKSNLSDLANWGAGGTPLRKNLNYYGGNIPWVKTGDLGPRLLKKASEYITQEGLENSSAKLFLKGSVAMAMYGATIGKTSIFDFDAATNQACAVGAPFDGLTTTVFLYYLLLNEKDNFISKGKGGAQPNISQQIIKEHAVALPPLNEQIRIANKLDQLLAKVDATKAHLDKIPTILKRFRQSVLAAATSGRLTEEWRGEHSVKYVRLTLGESGIDIKTGPFGSALHKKDYIENGIPVINPMHINDGNITPRAAMTISSEKYLSLQAWKLEVGDVVLGRRGEMGRAAEVKNIDNGMLCGTGSMILRTGTSGLLPAYLCLILRSPTSVYYFESNSVGSTMVNLNQKIIKSLNIHYPQSGEQIEIVRRVEDLFAIADIVEKQYKIAKNRVNKLTQSILAKAFRGELVSQDPNDEPAEKLLERILAQRTLQQPAKKTAKKYA